MDENIIRKSPSLADILTDIDNMDYMDIQPESKIVEIPVILQEMEQDEPRSYHNPLRD